MAALGEKLRREREARGVSLREIAVATRIHENYLRALEENDYGALPGAVFVTGFLRNYAMHLGLDADKIVAEFEAMKIEPTVERNLVPGMIDDDEESRFSTLRVVGSLFLVLVIYIAYVNWPGSVPETGGPEINITDEVVKTPSTDLIEPIKPETEKKEILSDAEKSEQPLVAQPPVAQPPAAQPPAAQSPATQSPAAQSPVTKPSVAQPPATQSPVTKPVVKAAERAKAEIKKKPPVQAVTKKEPTPAATVKKKAVPRQSAAAKVKRIKKKKAARPKAAVPKRADVAASKKEYKHRLVVTAKDEDAWILVVADDEIVRDMFLRAGQKIVINGNDSINFTTGNASHVDLVLNGKPLNFEIPINNVLRSWNLPLPETE